MQILHQRMMAVATWDDGLAALVIHIVNDYHHFHYFMYHWHLWELIQGMGGVGVGDQLTMVDTS